MMTMLSVAPRRLLLACTIRNRIAPRFQSSVTAGASTRPARRSVSPAERMALRTARKERANAALVSAQGHAQAAAAAETTSMPGRSLFFSKWFWYVGLGLPTGFLIWGMRDENSPPAQFSRWIGLTDLVNGFSSDFAKPHHNKLLPDWAHIPNVPKDIPTPHTLVLDLESTLVSSTWDRKYGWRHAKRPGVDQFLKTLAQYYEIVLYSPSIEGIADPVVTSLDKEGCIMHRLYREATHYHNGIHVKDLNSLNRNVNRMIVLDDDPAEVQFNPENHIRVKPYTDPTDRADTTLTRILPFLVEIARENYSDIPTLLRQYQGMDADEIADEQDRRVEAVRSHLARRKQGGLAGLARGASLPPPELPATASFAGASAAPKSLTAKDIAGSAPPAADANDGLMGWMQRRSREKEEQQQRKLEKWNEVMMQKQNKRMQEQQQQA